MLSSRQRLHQFTQDGLACWCVYTALHDAFFMQSSHLTLSCDTFSFWLVPSCCRMFEMMAQYDLLMAHPSVCSDLESDSHLMDMLKRQPTNVLRYTTAVDILAPLFDMAFFQDSVVNTLHNATYGMPPKKNLRIGVKTCILCMLQLEMRTDYTFAQLICLARCTFWCMCHTYDKCFFFSDSIACSLTCSFTHLLTRSCTVISTQQFDAV